MSNVSCPFCGSTEAGSGFFCKKCAKPLRASTVCEQPIKQSNPPAPPLSQPNQSRFMHVAVAVIAVSVVFIAGLLAFPYIQAAIVTSRVETINSNEAFAIMMVRSIGTAQWSFRETEGKYGTLEQLRAKGLLPSDAEVQRGYRFEVKLSANRDSFEVFATPEKYKSTGIRSYYSSDNFVIRGADRAGLPASDFDPVLD